LPDKAPIQLTHLEACRFQASRIVDTTGCQLSLFVHRQLMGFATSEFLRIPASLTDSIGASGAIGIDEKNLVAPSQKTRFCQKRHVQNEHWPSAGRPPVLVPGPAGGKELGDLSLDSPADLRVRQGLELPQAPGIGENKTRDGGAVDTTVRREGPLAQKASESRTNLLELEDLMPKAVCVDRFRPLLDQHAGHCTLP
jgi:hypothetical protein